MDLKLHTCVFTVLDGTGPIDSEDRRFCAILPPPGCGGGCVSDACIAGRGPRRSLMERLGDSGGWLLLGLKYSAALLNLTEPF